VPAPAGAHDMQVHLTCAGSGCHSPADDRQPPLSRPMCLLCHEPQRDHEPDGICWDCHRVPYRDVIGR
jgi:hypothetical protein